MNAPDQVNEKKPDEAQKVEVPLVEIIVQASIAVGLPLHHFKIYPDGRVEGFEKLGASVVIVNRVPMLLGSIAVPLRQMLEALGDPVNGLVDFANSIESEVRRLSKDQQLMEPVATDPLRIEH